jgi:hypothetical protein
MEAIFKRVVFRDEWIRPKPWPWPLSWFQPPRKGESFEFLSYGLCYRWEATDREGQLIRAHDMLAQPALTLSSNDQPVTFAEILGPEFVPEVHHSQMHLLSVEARILTAATTWTRFFEGMADPPT